MILDIILGIVIVVCIIGGIKRGAIREIFALGGLITGVFVATKFYKQFAAILHISTKVANTVAFIIIFIVVVVIINLIGHLISKLINLLGAGFIDRILGGLLGFITGTLIAGLICLFLTAFTTGKQAVEKSKIAPVVFEEISWIRGILPQNIQDRLKWQTKREKKIAASIITTYIHQT